MITISIIFSIIIQLALATESTSLCKINNPETRESYNFFTLRNEEKNYRVKKDGVEILFNVCGSLVDSDVADGCDKTQSICMINPKPAKNIGAKQEPVQIIDKTHAVMEFMGTDNCSKGRTKKTKILISCSMVKSDPVLTEIVDDCDYTIEWSTPEACPGSGAEHKTPLDVCRIKDSNGIYDLTPLSADSSDYFIKGDDGTKFYLNMCRELASFSYPDVSIIKTNKDQTISAPLGRLSSLRIIPNQSSLSPFASTSEHTSGVLYKMTNGDRCDVDSSSLFSAEIFLECNHAVSDSLPQFTVKDGCTYKFKWTTKYACLKSEGVDGDSCKVETNSGIVNLNPLRKTEDGNYEVSGISRDKTLMNKILINGCGKLIQSSSNVCDGDTAICGLVNGDKGKALGRRPKISQVGESIVMKYEDGDICPTDDKNRIQTIVTYTCNDALSEPSFKLVDSINDCIFNINVENAVICNKVSSEVARRTSVGMIFFWIIFSFVVAYLGLGVAYKRYVLGYTGLDQIPNIDLWLSIWDSLNCRRQPEYAIQL